MVRQSGFPRGQRLIQPLDPSKSGIDVKTRQTTFVYWTVGGQKRSAKGPTNGRIQFEPPLRSIAQAIGGLDAYTRANAEQRMWEEAYEIEREMQRDHPWTNRSYAAEASLYATVRVSKNKLAIVAGYDERTLLALQARDRRRGTWPRNYSVFLETMQGGRLGIVGKTLESRYGSFMDVFSDMWHSGRAVNEGFSAGRQRRNEAAFRRARFRQLSGGA